MGNTNSDQLDDCDGRDEAPSVALRPLRSTDVMGYENEADILDHWSHVLSLNVNNNLLVIYISNKSFFQCYNNFFRVCFPSNIAFKSS